VEGEGKTGLDECFRETATFESCTIFVYRVVAFWCTR
jgi:hypothetical protein